MEKEDEFLTDSEVAALLRMHIRTLRNRICANLDMPPRINISPKHRIWSRDGVMAWLRAKGRQTAPTAAPQTPEPKRRRGRPSRAAQAAREGVK